MSCLAVHPLHELEVLLHLLVPLQELPAQALRVLCYDVLCCAMLCCTVLLSCTGFTIISTTYASTRHSASMTYQLHMYIVVYIVSSEKRTCKLLNILLDHPMMLGIMSNASHTSGASQAVSTSI